MSPESPFLDAALPVGPGVGRWRWLPIRDLGASDRGRVWAHFLALDRGDRTLRFGFGASDAQICHYVHQIDLAHDKLFGVFNRSLRLLAIAHLAFEEGGKSAEFGVSVLQRGRGRGIGARLFEHAVRLARNRGARSLVLYVARNNATMLDIARRAGASLSFDGMEATVNLPLQENTLASQIEEKFQQHAAELDYRVKQQVLRLDRLFGRRAGKRRVDKPAACAGDRPDSGGRR
jgi:ribosomal protein S18 acetylase RimI-like enzyme